LTPGKPGDIEGSPRLQSFPAVNDAGRQVDMFAPG